MRPPRVLVGAIVFGSTILLGSDVPAQSPQDTGPSPIWKVEQAEIGKPVDPMPGQLSLPGQRMVTLKLALRNEGGAYNVPVKILGRWMTQPPRPFTLLGTYTYEIAFKEKAIVEVQLFPMFLPAGRAIAELSVVTGDAETDRYEIEVPE
jgi:hypothetical protein